jgi:pimeloyl-ACP methyl ester carboxylesterase
MLFIAFENDHIIPPKAARSNAEKYKAVRVEVKEFPGRPHFPGAPGWEEVADFAFDWVAKNARIRATA